MPPKKKKVKIVPEKESPVFDPLLYLKERLSKFPHTFAVERWLALMAFQPVRDFMLSLGVPDLSKPDSCKMVGIMLMHFKQLFNAQQQMALFDWINEVNRPMMIAWGVQSLTMRELFSTPDDMHRFYRMLAAWGYGIYQCPNAEPVTDEIRDLMNRFDLEM